jgi:hypothetical protein
MIQLNQAKSVFKSLVKVAAFLSFLNLSACNFWDALLGPPCTYCSGSSGSDYESGGYESGGYESGGYDSGYSGRDDRERNPPRYIEEPNPRRDERDARNREKERGARPPTQLQMATANLMTKFSIRPISAKILAEHLLRARTGDMRSIESMGITQKELTAMAKGQNPSARVLIKMAEVLRMDLGEVHILIQEIKTELGLNLGVF